MQLVAELWKETSSRNVLRRALASSDRRNHTAARSSHRVADALNCNTRLDQLAKNYAVRKAFITAATKRATEAAMGNKASSFKKSEVNVGVIYDSSMELHDGPSGHVENPQRTATLFALLQSTGLYAKCKHLTPRKAQDEELLMVHTKEHLNHVTSVFATAADYEHDGKIPYYEKGDLYYCKETAGAARTAAGCCVEAVKSVLTGTVQRALAVVRPPGHHAECDRAMGFCFFNNVAVAAANALKHPSCKKVAIIDWDVHHGNGIENVFIDNNKVLYISIHRNDNFYPFFSGDAEECGQGQGLGFNVNIPWKAAKEGDADYMAAFEHVVEPVLSSFAPDLVIVSAGYDAAEGDPLGGCRVSPQGYAHMTERLLKFAHGRVVLALEGGYNLKMTAQCATACLRVLMGEPAPALPAEHRSYKTVPKTREVLERVIKVQSCHWPCLDPNKFSDAWDAWELSMKMAAMQLQLKAEDVEPGAGSRAPSKKGGTSWVV